jgi:hypothetical protein
MGPWKLLTKLRLDSSDGNGAVEATDQAAVG